MPQVVGDGEILLLHGEDVREEGGGALGLEPKASPRRTGRDPEGLSVVADTVAHEEVPIRQLRHAG